MEPTDPYAKLFSERVIVLGGAVDDAAAHDVIAQLMLLEHTAPDRDVSLYLNSPGGSFSAMCAVHDTMRYIGCDIETVCVGRAGPAAAVLLAAGTPGKRMVLPHARVVLHQPSLDGAVRGRPDDLALEAGELLRERETMTRMLSEHTGRSAERVRRDLDRPAFLDAGAAVAYGLADHITVDRRSLLAPAGAR
ncbi:ATP-dependent Clp protease proteolytic subunit [Streptomyces griseocarneus]|uniref:ATP-dependent Clp protease proteolytic subunit n=1 Tax=Streptomyces griseocarneus TaxID=51201 RepID=UPI0019C2DBB8|nr:ATP-dependent Clp protease proteolytic subunit [Streptomyces griseocarneus]MBZ6477446.1 ATP-dependent Clp protease proteolytic subunit [Streptomyces griseocarneus]GHG49564.1 putative ATP-dependent Clp protease proteolytic subunit-like protein [Streptomyces griseocarneus]